MTFILLGRDKAAPATIYFWCFIRWILGKNQWNDEQLIEARQCARTMREERHENHTAQV